MSKVCFGRSESYSQGWRGKTSHTPIRLGDQQIGEIHGQENAGISGAMSYEIVTTDHAFWHGFQGRKFYTIADAKAAIFKWGESR